MNTTIIQVPEGFRIERAFDGRFYPQVWDGAEYEYLWDENGDDLYFTTEGEAQAYILNRQGAA